MKVYRHLALAWMIWMHLTSYDFSCHTYKLLKRTWLHQHKISNLCSGLCCCYVWLINTSWVTVLNLCKLQWSKFLSSNSTSTTLTFCKMNKCQCKCIDFQICIYRYILTSHKYEFLKTTWMHQSNMNCLHFRNNKTHNITCFVVMFGLMKFLLSDCVDFVQTAVL